MKKMGKLFILLAVCASFTLTSCKSTEVNEKPLEVLDVSLTRDDFKILDEETFVETMKNEVEPRLESIKTAGKFDSNHGHGIYYEYFDVEDEKGSVMLLHGFSEFVKKYNEIIYYFTNAGYDVYMAEHFGHGYSERSEKVDGNLSKIVVEDFEIYVDDAFQFITDIVNKERDQNKPFVLFGHSMGGGVATRLLEKYPATFDAAILSSPMHQVNTGSTPSWLASMVANTAKFFGAGDHYVFGYTDFTGEEYFDSPTCSSTSYPRYRYAFDNRLENEYYQTEGATWYWLDAAIDATKEMLKEENARNVTLPVLLFQAENDALVMPEGQLKFASIAPNVRIVFCPESHHEVYNTPNKIAYPYWCTIFNFLDEVLK